jgi:hypothetical protein
MKTFGLSLASFLLLACGQAFAGSTIYNWTGTPNLATNGAAFTIKVVATGAVFEDADSATLTVEDDEGNEIGTTPSPTFAFSAGPPPSVTVTDIYEFQGADVGTYFICLVIYDEFEDELGSSSEDISVTS